MGQRQQHGRGMVPRHKSVPSRKVSTAAGLADLVGGQGAGGANLDAAVKKAGIASARRIIVAADGSKLGHTTHGYVGPSTFLHILVTDSTAPADEVAALEGAGTVVKTA